MSLRPWESREPGITTFMFQCVPGMVSKRKKEHEIRGRKRINRDTKKSKGQNSKKMS